MLNIKNRVEPIVKGFNLHLRVVRALFLRETKTRFGDRRLGYIWAFLEPSLHVMTFVAIRKAFGMSAPAGIPMPLYLMVGIVPYFTFSRTASQVMASVRGNKALLVFPQVRIIDFIGARALLEYVTMNIVLWVLLFGMVIIGYNFQVENTLLFLIHFLNFSFIGIGTGLVLLAFNSKTEVVQIIWPHISRVLYITSGVVITVERFPKKYYDILGLNPLLQLVEMTRSSFFFEYDSSAYFNNIFYVWCWILGMVLVGLTFQKIWLRWVLAD